MMRSVVEVFMLVRPFSEHELREDWSRSVVAAVNLLWLEQPRPGDVDAALPPEDGVRRLLPWPVPGAPRRRAACGSNAEIAGHLERCRRRSRAGCGSGRSLLDGSWLCTNGPPLGVALVAVSTVESRFTSFDRRAVHDVAIRAVDLASRMCGGTAVSLGAAACAGDAHSGWVIFARPCPWRRGRVAVAQATRGTGACCLPSASACVSLVERCRRRCCRPPTRSSARRLQRGLARLATCSVASPWHEAHSSPAAGPRALPFCPWIELA